METFFNNNFGTHKPRSAVNDARPPKPRRSSYQRRQHESGTEIEVQKKDRAQVEAYWRQAHDLQKELDRERTERQKTEDMYQAAVAEMKNLEARLIQAERDVKWRALKIAELERANVRLEKERGSTAALLETKSSELRETQAFLDKTDDVADTDILRNVKHLNSKIFHTAARIADSSHFRYASRRDIRVADQASQRLEQDTWLDVHLLTALRSIDHARDGILVQTALQAALIKYVQWLATSWTSGQCDPEGLLHALYIHVKRREPPSVAGRWRAICRTNIKALADKEDMEPRRHTRTLTRLLTDVLLVCGVSRTEQNIYDVVKKMFGSALYDIVELTFKFHRVTGEVIVSRDLMMNAPTPGVAFDHAIMDDDWADPKGSHSTAVEQVLCTTQLGLMKEESLSNGKEAAVAASPTLLLKPKVVLKSMLEQLWNEQTACAGSHPDKSIEMKL